MIQDKEFQDESPTSSQGQWTGFKGILYSCDFRILRGNTQLFEQIQYIQNPKILCSN